MLRGLHARLQVSGYIPDALRRLLGIAQPDDVGPLNHTPACERIRDDRSPAATLTRLFFLEEPETNARVATALSPALCAELVHLGLLRRRDGKVTAQMRIDPVDNQYFMADRRFRRLAANALRLPGRDPVYPPSSDSLLLREAINAPTARRVLDLCTGSGVQALRHLPAAERITAVDLNPRAATVARLNAALNGVGNVEVRLGDLYAPVRGEQFDLIIANPPFVASPYSAGPAYHSGGSRGDRVLRRIISGWEAHLAPGGRAFAITHCALRAGEPIEAVACSWFHRFSGRALVLVLEQGTAVDLAAAQSLFALDRGLATYAQEVRRWVTHLRRRRIHTVALLLIVAARAGQRRVEVVDAQPRVLPIPLTASTAERIAAWLG
jgi:carbamoyltransferase